VRIEVATDGALFARLRPAWEALRAASGLPGPFADFLWQYEWWGVLGGGRSLRILVAREGSDTVGILPLFEENRLGARRLALVGSAGGGADYLDAPARDDRVRGALLRAAAGLGADLLELDDLDVDGPLLAAARATAGPSVLDRYPCPYLPVSGSWEEYLARHPRRENLRRRERWLASQPGFRIVCETDPDAVPAFLATFARLHAARWASEGGSQAFSDRRLLRFHARTAQRMAEERRLRLWSLQVAGETAAVVWAFDDRTRSCYFQSGYAPAWGARSVGLVLFAAFVRDAFDRGLFEVDLLHGGEKYKAEWATRERRTASVRWPLTARGRLALATRAAAARARRGISAALPGTMRIAATRLVREARMQAERRVAP